MFKAVSQKRFSTSTQNIKIFLIAILVSLPFWWGINVLEKNLEDFFFWKITQNLNLTAQVSEPLIDYSSLRPIRNWEVEGLEIEAKSAISVEVTENDKPKILFEKASDEKLPIASLTKLMTAYIVLENNYDLSDTIEITQQMVNQEGETGDLKAGEIFRIDDILYMSLMESSNDATYALSGGYGKITSETFVSLMNVTAKELGLENTYFINPTGLDPDHPEEPINYSTTKDLAKFTQSLLKQPLIFDISSTPELDCNLANGVFHHRIKNTNELLREDLDWSDLIVGGKTGWTPEAQGCLLLVVKSPKPESYLINIILGSGDRFGEIKKLVDWTLRAYNW